MCAAHNILEYKSEYKADDSSKKNFIEKLRKNKEKINKEYLKNINFLNPHMKPEILLDDTGYPLINNNILDETHLGIIYKIVSYIKDFLADMKREHVSLILKEIEMKYPELNLEPIINDEIIDNGIQGLIKRRTVTIGDNGDILRFVFDIEKTIKQRDVATVYRLDVNNENRLDTGFVKHQLYSSTGFSRGASQLKDKWLPYNGDRADGEVAKSEDKFYMLCQDLLLYVSSLSDDDFILKLNELMSNASKLIHYMRLINENYAISSYLLEKFKYEPFELTEEQKSYQKTDLDTETRKKIFGSMLGLPSAPSQSKFFYEKYLKYKEKYINLKYKFKK
jgi:hypothetical protein